MKKVVRKIGVYFLSLALLLPNFSIPTYASEALLENVAEESLNSVFEEDYKTNEGAVSENNI